MGLPGSIGASGPPGGRDVGWARPHSHDDTRGGKPIVSTALFGILAVSLAVAVAGLALVQRLVPLSIRQTHNTATGTIYSALYVLFGVTLGFLLLLV
jgi:hypothetical protein